MILKIKRNLPRRTAFILLIFFLGVFLFCLMQNPAYAAKEQEQISTENRTYDVTRFKAPAGTKVLVVAEGFAVNGGKSTCKEGAVEDSSRWNKVRVTAYYRDNDSSAWTAGVQSAGVMGWNGMSSQRIPGNGETPIGFFQMNTPFGRRAAEEGFPSDYTEIMISSRNQYWSDTTNRLETNPAISAQNGERLWEDWAQGIYSYALDFGFNKDNANKDGSALFLHCTKEAKPSTAGCIAIDTDAMAAILKLYAKGNACIAISPAGQFDKVYDSWNETGKSPDGDFTNSVRQMDPVSTVILD